MVEGYKEWGGRIMLMEEVVSVITDISNSIEDKDVSNFPFILMTDGCNAIVEFAGCRVWSREDDCREFDDDTNDYEPLKDYLIAQARKVLFEYSDLLDRIGEGA